MPTLPQIIVDPEILIALPPEELAAAVLQAAASDGPMFSALGVTGPEVLYGRGIPGAVVYPRDKEAQITEALGEAWQWLELNMLIMPAPGPNGANGWKVLTRRGRDLAANPHRFASYMAAASFPRSLLHPLIADTAWLDLARGDFQTAVFRSFRTVEEVVRHAGGYAPEDHGVDLMRRAFNPKTGPLRKPEDPAAEREALANLFAGAIGSYKNPHSHRTVIMRDPQEAQEMVMLASHLIKIVDARWPG